MRLLLINYEFPPVGGGASTATYYIGKGLVKLGYHVSVLTARLGDLPHCTEESGMQVYRCSAMRRKKSQSSMAGMFCYLLSAASQMPKVIRKHKIEQSIVFFSLPCGPLGLWGQILFGLPYIVSIRGGDVPGTEPSLRHLHTLLGPLRRDILKKSNAVVANSNGLKALSERTDPFPVHVIPNGVDTHFFHPTDKGTERQQPLKFLFVGRFREQKNLFFLLDQMNRLTLDDGTPFELHMVGGGPQENSLKWYGSSLDIRQHIHWHGWASKEELRRHYQNADCLINPSLYEGMPNVVLEAMACGLPVIASNVIGNNAVIRNGDTGLLFNLNEPEGFRESVRRILANAPYRTEIGQRGRAAAICDFSWDRVAEAYASLLMGKGHRAV